MANPTMDRFEQPSQIIHQQRKSLFEKKRNLRRQKASTDATASEAASIQQSLGRTQKLLQNELARVASVQHAIEDDEKLLKKTMDTHKTLNVLGAKKALTALERAQQQERRVFALSVLFFWLCVFYVLWCRILIRIPFLDRISLLFYMLVEKIARVVAKFYE
jgi:small-conductance mechanosensitive channel